MTTEPNVGTHRDDRPHRSDSRVPPHDIEAEEASLGAALLNAGAVETIVAKLSPADYYKPGHRWIFAAIRDVVGSGTPVDPVTVADALRRAGTLEDVGGLAYVAGLMNATPAISNVEQYARIVKNHSVLRNLLYASSDIADAAYSGLDPDEALAKAQDALVRLGDASGAGTAGSTLDVADLAELLRSDLKVEQPDVLVRSDGQGLLYSGKLHVLQAEPSSGKSWVAFAAVKEMLDLGGSAIVLDYEDTPISVVTRLLSLGADPDSIAERMQYVRPVGRHGPKEQLQLSKILAEMNPDLVVIDGVGESLSRNGMSENEADDVLRWTDLLPRPCAAGGAAVLMIDHVAKDPEHRGRWARGSGAKLGVLDGVAYQVKVISPFSREKAGAIKLVIAKDRPGGVGAIGETAAIITIDPHAHGEHITLSIDPDGSRLSPTDSFKPTHVMEKVSREIEDAVVPQTAGSVKALLSKSDPKIVSAAIARLLAEGFVEQNGKGKTATLRSVKRFRAEYLRTVPDPDPDDDLEPPATLDFDTEPEWMRDEARAVLDHLSTDPKL